MKLKELRAALRERGVECTGCSEKQHFVERLIEVQDAPVLSEEELASKQKSKQPEKKAKKGGKKAGGSGDSKDEEVAKLMESLKAAGFNGQVYGSNDIEKMMADFKDKGEL